MEGTYVVNPLATLGILGAAWYWLSRPARNPYDPDAPIIGGIDGKSSAAMRRLANMAGYTRSINAAKRREAREAAEAAAREVREREEYQPVAVPRVKWAKGDFFSRKREDGTVVRIPLRQRLGDRYQDARTRTYAAEVASTRTEANALRTEEREIRSKARELGADARTTYLDNLEFTVKELGGDRQKVAAFLPADRRKWIDQDVTERGEYLGEDADGFPIFTEDKTRRKRRYITYDTRTGVPVGLHTGAWGKAFRQYLDAQRIRWRRVRDTDASRQEEASYYLSVIDHHETVRKAAEGGAREEERVLRQLSRRRAQLDAKAAKLAAELTAERKIRKRKVTA